MIKLSKLTDYGFVLLTRFADSNSPRMYTARDLADQTGLPLPTVSKLLKVFNRGGLLSAHRGAHGGYNLTRSANDITATDIIEAIDGPIATTDCIIEGHDNTCSIEHSCPTKPHWVQITHRIRTALDQVTLAQLAKPLVLKSTPEPQHATNCHAGQCATSPHQPCSCTDHHRPNTGDNQ